MHIRHVFFILHSAFFILAGCGESHLTMTMPDSGTPIAMGDAYVVPGHDSGYYIWPDSGPALDDAGSDAGSDAGTAPIVRIVFDGPAESDVLRGSQDQVMYAFSVSSTEDVELRFLDFTIEGVTSSDRLTGSAGTELFRDLKLKDLDTGMTLMGPVTLATSRFTDAFIIHAGETRHFGLTMDISNHEDVPGEFFDGTHRYRVTVGDARFGHFFESAAVREVATGVFLGPEVIENNSVISGNIRTVVDAELAVSMAVSPVLTVAVKKEIGIRSVGLAFTAGASDILIRTVRLSGVGNLDGRDAASDLHAVIAACSLFNGATQVGFSRAPDTLTGRMDITGVNVTVPAYSTIILEARCTADSVVMGDYDLYSIGIADVSDIDAVRSDLFAVTPSLSDILRANAASTTDNFVMVLNQGRLTVAPDSLRQSTILVAGGDVWQNFAQYRATAQDEGVDIEELRIASRGDASSFTQVAVAVDGAVMGWCILPAGTDRSCDVTLDSPIRIPRDGSRIFQIWGKLSNVVSTSSVSPGTPRCAGYACSGAFLRLGVEAGNTLGDWDANYAGSLNIRTSGGTSGDRLYAAGSTALGNTFVVRRSKPTFVRQTLSTTTLANGIDADLYRFQIAADSAGSIAVMGLRFDLSVGSAAGSVSRLGIRRGAFEMTDATVTYTGTSIVVTFASEETITGSGNVYTLHGVTNGFVSGDSLAIGPHREPSSPIDTGYVMPGLVLQSEVGTYHPGLLWSDLSEIPHSAVSWDWTSDGWVEDLTRQQVLTR